MDVLASQTGGDDEVPAHILHATDLRNRYAKRARTEVGQGPWDAPVVQHEVRLLLSDWDSSRALTPDLLPRAVLFVGNSFWQDAVWRLIRLTGPGLLACRPSLWRAACLDTVYKSGPCAFPNSFRLLSVRVQMGLLQEAVLAARIKPQVRACLTTGQSGYVRDVEDPLLALHELLVAQSSLGRSLWICFADFVKAFPRTDRSDLLTLLYSRTRIRGGAWSLLEDIFAWDCVHVLLSGHSSVIVTNGLPEGGSLGPLCYTTLPDTLFTFLTDAGFGVGIDLFIPVPWRGHVWSGRGSPFPAMVSFLVFAIRSGGYLPSCALLQSWPNLEASASRALDLCCTRRIIMFMHADDPVFVASSQGELQRTLRAVESWAALHRAKLHVGSGKTVVMHASVSAPGVSPLVLHDSPGSAPTSVHYRCCHRWLGVLWPHDLCFTATLLDAVRRAWAAFAPICNLVEAMAIPLTLALPLLVLKVDSVLNVGRWLFTLSPTAKTILDDTLDSWARSLLGGEAWRNGAVARSELGLHISGFLCGVRSVALRRARLWRMSDDDWYKKFFLSCLDQPHSWAYCSAGLLRDFAICDWPDVANICPTYDAYSRYVDSALIAHCGGELMAGTARHQAQVPYNSFQTLPSLALKGVSSSNLSWGTQLRLRCWFRMRAGLVCLRARNNQRSSAAHQSCIFCGCGVRNATVHVLAVWSHWAVQRDCFVAASIGSDHVLPSDKLCLAVLGSYPGLAGFPEAVDFCGDVDLGAALFWRSVTA